MGCINTYSSKNRAIYSKNPKESTNPVLFNSKTRISPVLIISTVMNTRLRKQGLYIVPELGESQES